MFTVYILYSDTYDKVYIGHTNDMDRRINEHNETGTGYTAHFRPWRILFQETFEKRVEAMKIEKYLKSLKNKERIYQYIAGWRSSTS